MATMQPTNEPFDTLSEHAKHAVMKGSIVISNLLLLPEPDHSRIQNCISTTAATGHCQPTSLKSVIGLMANAEKLRRPLLLLCT
jgi:hypothetical protein